jgi:tetratricopeptide (TPR) repeat protein
VDSSKAFLSRKTEIVYFGSNPSSALLEVIDAKISRWSRMVVVNHPSKLDKYLNPEKFSQIGAVLIEPSFAEAAGATWIRNVQSKPAFIHLPWACLTVDPQEVGGLKSSCEYFFHEQGEAESLTHWNGRLDLLWTSHIHRIESDLLILVGKDHLRKEEFKQARECFEPLRKLLGNRSDVLCYLGDLYSRQKQIEKSEACYRQSVSSNPFNPHAYVKLLNQLEVSISPDLARWTAVAALTCEKHPQIIEILKRLQQGSEVLNFPTIENQNAAPVLSERELLKTGTK